MATSEHNFDPGTGERAYRWLFTLASQYSGGKDRGPVGECKPFNRDIDKVGVSILVSGQLHEQPIDGVGNTILVGKGNLIENGFVFENELVEGDQDQSGMNIVIGVGQLSENGFVFENETVDNGPDSLDGIDISGISITLSGQLLEA